MARISDLYRATQAPSKYLRAADLPDGWKHEGPIKEISTEEFQDDDGKEVKKLGVRVGGLDQVWILNRGSVEFLEQAIGPDTSDLIGARIELFRSETEFRGRLVPCIRPRLPKKQRRHQDDLQGDDEVPF